VKRTYDLPIVCKIRVLRTVVLELAPSQPAGLIARWAGRRGKEGVDGRYLQKNR
jgi:hypothetical protein